MYSSEAAAQVALQRLFQQLRSEGLRVSFPEDADFSVWVVRRADGAVHASYWLSDEEYGSALVFSSDSQRVDQAAVESPASNA
jgi:hypothetical protein